jgi:vacuolar-type H+-ATPase subunit I/STV1
MSDQLTGTFAFESIVNYFGIPQNIIFMAIAGCFMIAVSLFTYFYLGSSLLALFSTIPIIGIAVFLGVFPIWIAVIYAVMGFVVVYFGGFGGTDSETQPEYSDEWITYGNKLKNAYTAKFGGENPASIKK